MKKGRLYRLEVPSWIYDADTYHKVALCCAPQGSVVVYLEASQREPYWHRVIYQDQVGYLAVMRFTDFLLTYDHAEPQTET